MPTFHGGMRELADHKRPWVRLRVDASGARLGPWMPGVRRMPSYVFSWSQVERVEPLTDRYLSGPGVRFVLRTPVPSLEGPPNAARWPDARQPVFLCGTDRRLRAVLSAIPATLITRTATAPPQPQAGAAPS